MSTEPFEIAGFRIAPSDCLGLIQQFTSGLRILNQPPVCVDIGASDGLMFSNTLFLYMNGWQGLSLEADPEAFARMQRFYTSYLPQVELGQMRITPENVCEWLQRGIGSRELPLNFDFLSLDIDSYDYDVLKSLLQQYRPKLICAEINEKIPPPIRFWVPYRPDHSYTGDHFYGMSLAALADLADQNGYDLVRLHFNNAFLVAREHNLWPVQSLGEAYATGCLSFDMPAYNLNMAPLLSMTPPDAIAFIHTHFAAYHGRYVCYLPEDATVQNET